MNGLSVQTLLVDAAAALVGFAANWLLQSTLLIAAGLSIGWMLRRRGSAVQSAVYRTTLLAVIVCPLATSLLALVDIPGWSLEMPAAWTLQRYAVPLEIPETEFASAAIVSARSDAPPFPADDWPAVETSAFPTGTAAAFGFVGEEPRQDALAALPVADSHAVDRRSATSAIDGEEATARAAAETWLFQIRPFGWLAIGISLFGLAVSAVLLFRLSMAWRRMNRLRSTATAAEAATQRVCQELAALLSVSPPEVLRSPYLSSPCLAGLTRPAVLLPEADPSSPIRDVLVHELAHLRRRDCHWNLLRHLAGALLFYQPLLWKLSRRLEETAEEVCDDFVVQYGGDREAYAHRLVDIAAFSSTPASVAGVGIVSLRSILAKRVSRILDTSRSLSTRAGNLLLAVVIAGGLALTLAVGLVGLGPHSSLADAAADEPVTAGTPVEGRAEENATADANRDDESTANVSLPSAAASLQPETPSGNGAITYAGKVVDPMGSPVSGAELYLVYHVPEPTAPLIPSWKPLAVTDAAGDFRFTMGESDFGEGASAREWKHAALCAVAPGHGFACSAAMFFESGRDAVQEMRERLKEIPVPFRESFEKMLAQAGQPLRLVADDQPLRGQVVDINGQGVMGAKLTLLRTDLSYDESLDAWLEEAGSEKADFYSARDKTPLMLNGPQVRSLVTPAVTGPDGRFTLRGVGRERIVQLLVEGPGIQADTIYARTRAGERIELLQERRSPNLGNFVYHPAELTHVAGPSKPIVGRVRNKRTGDPLAGITIKSQERHGNPISGWGQDFVRTVTDDQGRYRLEGMPIGSDNRIAAIAPEDRAYLSTSHRAATDIDAEQLEIDFALTAAVWLEGRVTDASTGKGVPGRISYLVNEDNPDRDAAAGLGSVDERDRHQAAEDGRFRVPGLPGPGYVTFEADDHEKYARATGITTADGQSLPVAGGILRASRTLLPISSYHVIAEVNPQQDSGRHELNLQLDSGGSLVGRFADRDSQPLGDTSGIYYSGRLAAFSMSWDLARGDSFEVIGYEAARPRRLVFYDPQQNLAGSLLLQGQPPEPLVAQLLPAGKVRGRLVDRDGQPLTDLQLVPWMPPQSSPADMPSLDGVELIGSPLPPNRGHHAEHEIGVDGRFEIDGLAPGLEYRLRAMDRQRNPLVPPQVFQPLDAVIQVQAGETLDLGDVRLADEAEFSAREKSRATRDAANDQASKTGPIPAAIETGIVTGRVTHGGQPAAGAHVAIIGSRIQPMRGSDLGRGGEVIAAEIADENGLYRLSVAGASSKTHRYVGLIARKEGTAIAWRMLNLDSPSVEIALELPREEPIQGKLIDIEGQPAAGVTLKTVGVQNATDRFGQEGVGYPGGDEPPAAWLPPVTSDEQGRFTIRGVPAGHGVHMHVEGSDRFAPEDIALNTGMPEQRGERDATYRSLVKNVEPGEEAVLTVPPAQWFEGVVRYEDSGEPAAHARITIWASQEGSGSMTSVAGQADEQGRYRINPKPGVRFGLTAYPPAGTTYLARQTPLSKAIRWEAGDRVKQVDITLPRGVLVRGTIRDAGTGEPVAGAAVQYRPQSANNPNVSDEILTGWQDIQLSNEEGRFSITVLPGPGHLLVHGQDNHVLQEIGSRQLDQGQPGGVRCYAHAIELLDPEVDAEPLEVAIELQSGGTVAGQIVDPQGELVEEALVISRLKIFPTSLSWRGHTAPTLGGRFELAGLANDREYPVHFLNVRRQLGATAIFKTGGPEQVDVALQPCGKARLRMVDSEGEPVVGYEANLYLVVTPGALQYDGAAMQRGELAADADFVENVDRSNHASTKSDPQGFITFPALIPGATYRILSYRDGQFHVAKDFQAQANETLDLGDLLVERPQ